MARSTARVAAMQLIYARMLGGDGGERTLDELIVPDADLTVDDRAYLTDVAEGAMRAQAELDARIGACATGWSVARMARVDLAILRLSAYEMLYRDDVPPAVSINEAVELSRHFSTGEAGAFINGVLGSLHRGMQE